MSSAGVFASRANLLIARDAWCEDAHSAARRFGPIQTWDVSQITNLSHVFCSCSTSYCAQNMPDCNPRCKDFNEDISFWDVACVTRQWKDSSKRRHSTGGIQQGAHPSTGPSLRRTTRCGAASSYRDWAAMYEHVDALCPVYTSAWVAVWVAIGIAAIALLVLIRPRWLGQHSDLLKQPSWRTLKSLVGSLSVTIADINSPWQRLDDNKAADSAVVAPEAPEAVARVVSEQLCLPSLLAVDTAALGAALSDLGVSNATLLTADERGEAEMRLKAAENAQKGAREGSSCEFVFIKADAIRQWPPTTCSHSDVKGGASVSKSLPRLQALLRDHSDCLETRSLTFEEICSGACVDDYLAVSHRWLDKSQPDPDGEQFAALQSFLTYDLGSRYISPAV